MANFLSFKFLEKVWIGCFVLITLLFLINALVMGLSRLFVFMGMESRLEFFLFLKKKPGTVLDLLKIIDCETYNRKPVLMGFSLGGRVALSLYEAVPEKFCKLILLAPDGLKINFWYWLSTQTLMGRRIFSFTMKHPGWFFGFLKLMNKLKLVNASIFKFVKYYIDNEEMRTLLYKRWICLRKLKPNLKKIKRAVKETQTPVRLMYGKHDRIILPVVGERFRKGIEDYCTITIIEAGHQVLHNKHVDEIVNLILD